MTDPYPGPDRRQSQPAQIYPPWVLPGLAFFALIAFAAVSAASFMTNDATLRTQTTSTWSNIAIAVIAYWFGSSAGKARQEDAAARDNAEKTKALAVSAPTAPVVVTAAVDPGQSITATTTEPKAGG